MPVWLIVLLVSVVLETVAFVIMPRPKQPKPPAVQDAQAPTAEAGIPQIWLFGTLTIDGTNVLWWGDKATKTYTVSA